MPSKKTIFALVVGSVGIMNAMSVQAVSLVSGSLLSIEPGEYTLDIDGNPVGIASGSWFAFDFNGDGKIRNTEKIALSPGFLGGILIGTTTSSGASHTGSPTAGDTNAITAPWALGNSTGSDYLVSPVTDDTANGLDMSGWRVTLNGTIDLNLGGGAWGAGFNEGVGNFVFLGGTYTLDYHAAAPQGSPDGFSSVQYALHLEGFCGNVENSCVSPTPEASTYTMMLAGLGLIGFATRRRQPV